MNRSLLNLSIAVITLTVILVCQSNADTPIRLTLRDTTIVSGVNLHYAICVDSSLSGYSVRSYQITVGYDTTWFSFKSVTATGTVDSTWGQPAANEVSPGLIKIASAGLDSLDGTGKLVVLLFTSRAFSGSANQSAFFTFQSSLFNEGSPTTDFHDGIVTLTPASSTSALLESASSAGPFTFYIDQNFPNPFNPSTIIRYGLGSRSMVRLVIYNILGQIVDELVNGQQNEGLHAVIWNPSVPSGAYFYRIEASSMSDPTDHFTQIRKMVLMK